jgi:hypothetical protein
MYAMTQGEATMWGFTVEADGGQSATLYCEDKNTRDAWVSTMNVFARGSKSKYFWTERYTADYEQPLGSGLFAVVLKAFDMQQRVPVAIKIIKAQAYREYRDMIQREVMVSMHECTSVGIAVRWTVEHKAYSDHRAARVCPGLLIIIPATHRCGTPWVLTPTSSS